VHVRSRLAPALVAAVVTCCSALAGCGGDDPEPTASSSSASSPAEETSASPTTGSGDTDDDGGTDAPPFPADAETDTADPSSDSLVTVTDIRVGRHDGFDRVVFEVDGTGTPGWSVQYVDDPSSQGSGEPVDVEGDAVLQVVLTGVGYPYDTGVDEYASHDPLSAADTETVTEVVFDGTFEGQTEAFVGTAAEVPFRVYLLEGPTRVVLEVADQG
jgi:hypothetical protein